MVNDEQTNDSDHVHVDLDNIQVIENNDEKETEETEDDDKEEYDDSEHKSDESVGEDVIENKSVHIDYGRGVHLNSSKPNEDIEMAKPKEPTTPAVRATKYKSPILPKVLVILVIILIMSVIALAFVLYHLDQDLSKSKTKTNSIFSQLEGDEAIIKRVEDWLGKKNGSIAKVKKELTGSVNKLKEGLKNQSTSMGKLENKISNKLTALKKSNYEFNETLVQLFMYLQYTKKYQKTIGMTFDELVKLTKKPNRLDVKIPTLQLLEYQHEKFNTDFKTKWSVDYAVVLKLTDKIDFKLNEDIPLLTKIDCMFSIFKPYQTTWGIKFADIMRLTKLKDIAEITLKGWLELQKNMGTSPLMEKIIYMYEVFEKDYQGKWNIPFWFVVDRTEEITFQVNGSIPILQKIDSWYLDGYKELWGDGFQEYLSLMLKKKATQKDIISKLQHINDTGKVIKFLPGKFEYLVNELSVYGFIALYQPHDNNTRLETIRSVNLEDTEADVLCRSAGYSTGVFAAGKYKVGKMDRSNIAFGFDYISCKGVEKKITDCTTDKKKKSWDHKEDAGIKCYF